MSSHRWSIRSGTVIAAATLMLWSPFVGAVATQRSASSAIDKRADALSSRPTIDGGWPKAFVTTTGGSLVIYQPQVASWAGQVHLIAYSAVAYTANGGKTPALGTIRVESDTRVALDERLVSFAELKITAMNFGSLSREEVQALSAELTRVMPEGERVIALDRLLANIDKSQIIPKNVDDVKADPPAIFFSPTPAVLVNLDGDPIWGPIKDTDLKYVINTNWDLFEHGPSKAYYLRNDQVWLKAPSITGPWTPAGPLPASFTKLPADENWKDVTAALSSRRVDARQAPAVFVSTTPAELVLLRGAPTYLLVDGTRDLLWVENTESDVFRVGRSGPVYYLVAGRWFSAPDFKGPWTFATPNLPPSFRAIPLEHPRSRVLASVPGTQQAAEAVLLTQVPQTARVNRTALKPPDVTYQGDPEFQSIPRTSVARAVNTNKDVIRVSDLYYLCFQGIWFVSRSAQGPWEVTSDVPSQIYEIPASSPAHYVTYVTVVKDKRDEDWVTFAAVPGYTGMMVAWGCAVWGTGWYYPPYVSYGGYHPIYYPYYPTYGYSAWYNPWTATYGGGAVAYGPYGGVGATARYNPATGTYARGAMAWGPRGATGAAQAYNPRAGAYGQTRQGAGVYGSWGSTYVQRGDDWAQTTRVTNRATGNTTRVTRGDEGMAVSHVGANGGSFVAGVNDSIYAGHDGNVYRRADGGGWQKYENGSWGETQHPERASAPEPSTPTAATPRHFDPSTMGQLERDRAARAEGARRTGDYGRYRRGDGRGAGSYRSGAPPRARRR
jgi:hypothetical protein